MKALVKAEGGSGAVAADVPEPVAQPGEVLIKVLRTGICGTDLHIRRWDGWAQAAVPPPLVLGHEFVGEVVAIGAASTTSASATWSAARGTSSAARCRNCLAGRRHLCRATVGLGVDRDGAFAEYVAAARDQRVGAPAPGGPRRGCDLRPVRQRRAHGAVVPAASARTC